MSIRDALLLRNATLATAVGNITARRPSAADVIEMADLAAKDPNRLYAHLVFRHLLDEHGAPVFDSIDGVLNSDGVVVLECAKAIERLYGEGRD
jgi:hypothetical protein